MMLIFWLVLYDKEKGRKKEGEKKTKVSCAAFAPIISYDT